MKEKKKIDLNLKINKQKRLIEKELKKTLVNISAPKDLKSVMSYAVLNGGKRIRPFIVSEVSKLYKVNYSTYKYPSMAIEMAHCFSLIYDDLPCMDDDDLRRGKPSVHIKFNEANALLGGASLLIFAYNTLSSKKFIIDKKKKLLLLESFSNSIGHEGMLAGQF
ncbi:MAG: Farnesyl diphosphate synthase, partial [Alphaproteobacteria bacterium MarineAlpha9_Bin4]